MFGNGERGLILKSHMLHFSSWETFLCSSWLCALQAAILEEMILIINIITTLLSSYRTLLSIFMKAPLSHTYLFWAQ